MAICYEPPICPRCGLRHTIYRCPPNATPIREVEAAPPPEAPPQASEAPPAAIEPPPAPKKPPFDRKAYQQAYMAPYMRDYRARRKAAAQQTKDSE